MDIELERLINDKRLPLDEFGIKFVAKESRRSLEENLLENKDNDTWKKCAHNLGEFTGKFCSSAKLAVLSTSDDDYSKIKNIAEKNRLKNWLENNLEDPDDSILSVLPCQIKDIYKAREADKPKSVGSNLQELGFSHPSTSEHSLKYKARKAVQLLSDDTQCLVLQNLRADSVCWVETDMKVFKSSDFGLTTGPLSLQLSINMADFFVLYYQMIRSFYVADVTLAQMCNELGKAYKDTIEKELKTTVDDCAFWKQVALLAGWEILRRCHTQDNVSFEMNESGCGGSDDCVNAALRLIGVTKNLDSVGLLTFIGFALC